jgi:hypothetical protein
MLCGGLESASAQSALTVATPRYSYDIILDIGHRALDWCSRLSRRPFHRSVVEYPVGFRLPLRPRYH